MSIDVGNLIANPPALTLENVIALLYNCMFILVMALLLIGWIFRRFYLGVPALVYLIVTIIWKKAWIWWSMGLCTLVDLIAGLWDYHVTPAEFTAYVFIPVILNLILGLYITYRPNALVKIVGRLRIRNGLPVLEWYGLPLGFGRRLIILPPTKSVKSLFRGKANKNVYICGISGSGKTYASNSILSRAFKDKPILALSFKPRDSTLNLSNFTVIDISRTPINVFENVEAFIRAYMIAFPVEKTGLMISSVPTILKEALKNSKSWDDLINNLKVLADSAENAVRKATIEWILKNIEETIKPEMNSGKGWMWDFRTNVVLDFSNLNENQKSFFAEFILNMIWKKLQQEERMECVIFIDEAHRILRKSWMFVSVLDEMAREIRGLGGTLIIVSQNLTDIDKGVLNQFDTQLVFNTTKKEDLDAIRAINPYLVDLVTKLPPHVCIDLRQKKGDIELYQFLPPKWEKKSEHVEVKLTEGLDKTPSVDKTLEISKTEVSGKTAYIPDPEFDAKVERAIIEYLSNREIGYVTRMARDLSPKLGKDSSRLKADLNRIFKKLVAQGIVSKSDFINENGIRIVYYWLKEKGESPFHRVLVNTTYKLLSKRFRCDIPMDGPDIVIYDNKRIAVECETGLKEDLSMYVEQVLKRFDQGFDEVWTICPTPEIAGKYRMLGIPNHRVFTLLELKKDIIDKNK
jgi:hypothetical protein